MPDRKLTAKPEPVSFELGEPSIEPTDKRRRPGTSDLRVTWPVTLSTGQQCLADLVVPAGSDVQALRPMVEDQIRRELANEGAPPAGHVLHWRGKG